jgi:septum formation protein
MAIFHHHPLILASGSRIRQQMLKSCGLTFSVEPSGVDEEALTPTLAHLAVPERALALAKAKALAVSQRHPKAYVIGADQMCHLNGQVFGKPGSFDKAESQLKKLSGHTHEQHCGCVIAHGGEIIWQSMSVARLSMRALTPAQIHAYVAVDAPLDSCGAYQFESLGRHLFSAVDGDHDVIKGLPLLSLLSELHARGVIGFKDAP